MSTMRVEEAEKNLTAVQTQLEVHIAGEMNATDTPAKFARWGDERRRLELEVERHVKLVDLAWQEDENDQRRELIAAADAQRRPLLPDAGERGGGNATGAGGRPAEAARDLRAPLR